MNKTIAEWLGPGQTGLRVVERTLLSAAFAFEVGVGVPKPVGIGNEDKKNNKSKKQKQKQRQRTGVSAPQLSSQFAPAPATPL
jgi:hypothetical protein